MVLKLDGDTDFRLLRLVQRTSDALVKVRKAELDQYRLSPIEAFALFNIDDLGADSTPAELSRRTHRQHNAVMALLRRMEKKGLVTMTRDSDRANTWRVGLTNAGETACRQAMCLDSVHEVMSDLSETEKQQLETFLTTVSNNALKKFLF